MKWLREAISDNDGLADMAYIAIGALTVTAIAALAYECAMTAIDYHACAPTISITNATAGDSRHIVPCRFDPLPIGQAAGLIFAGFATLIGSLAGYMAATRRRDKDR